MAAMRRTGMLLATLILGGALLGGCDDYYGDVPVQPSYSRDIAPLMTARCTRCHGAGGMLNKDPDMPPVIVNNAAGSTVVGDFTSMSGIMTYCGLMPTFIVVMPPPPSDALDSWSRDVLLKWCLNPQP
jgi:hypothetical protein